MHFEPLIALDNTAQAFVNKSNQQLKKAYYLFRLMNQGELVKIGIRLTLLAVKLKLPIKSLLKATIFEQFVGGETLADTSRIIKNLADHGVQVILDYGAEGKETEADFDRIKDEFIRVINHAAQHSTVPLIGIKVTGLARFELLEKLNKSVSISPDKIQIDTSSLTQAEREEWGNVMQRLWAICEVASRQKIGILIDAEESWIQDTVDGVTMQLMEVYNKGKVVVFNTLQLYRHDRLDFLKHSYAVADQLNFLLGAKIVRGAYMEKERKRAAERNEPTVIQPDKEASDRDFNLAIDFCIQHLDQISLIIASHNEYSTQYALQLLQESELPFNHPHIHFSQLYGMSDNITFNLAKAGVNVSKYLPYGPVDDVIPYLMRRAQENSSVAGQTSRELFLIQKEMKRRGI